MAESFVTLEMHGDGEEPEVVRVFQVSDERFVVLGGSALSAGVQLFSDTSRDCAMGLALFAESHGHVWIAR